MAQTTNISTSFSKYCTEGYEFAFNGQEKTDEVSGVGNHLDFKYRGYDPQTGRFWSVDPLFKDYPWNSTYCFAENDVIRAKDLEGAEKKIVTTMIHPNGIKITTTKENDVAGILGNGTLYRLIDCPKGALSADYTENGKSYTVPFNYAFPEFNLKAPSEGNIKQGYTQAEKAKQAVKKVWKTINEDGGAHGDNGTNQTLTKQDIQVGIGVLSIVVTGGLAAEGYFSYGTIYTLLTDVDQCTSDPNGESFVDRKLKNHPTLKTIYSGSQVVIGFKGKFNNLIEIEKDGISTFKGIEHLNSSVGIANDAISTGTNIKETQKTK